MRIAYLISEYPAVSHTFIRREVVELRRQGFEIDCFSIRPPQNSQTFTRVDQEELNSTWVLLPASPLHLLKVHLGAIVRSPGLYLRTLKDALVHRGTGVKSFLWSIFHFIEAITLAEEIRTRNVDRLHNHFSNAAANVGYLIARYLGLPWSLTLHGSADFDGEGRDLLGAKAAQADVLACISYYGKSQTLRRISPEDWKKVIVYRCGIDPALYRHARELSQGCVRLLTVGRLSSEKGQLGLIEAFAVAYKKNSSLRLTLVGEGPERHRLEAAVEGLGLSAVVKLPGACNEEQVAKCIAASDIFVLSSFMEGLPVVLMEAMASGVPVIAPNVAGIPELVEHGSHGLLFQPSDWNALAAHISTLAEDQALRSKFSQNGRQRVQEEFDIQVAVKPLIKSFRHE